MKKLISLILTICMITVMLPVSFAATPQTVTRPADYVENYFYENSDIAYKFDDVTVTVTYTGYLGEIAASNYWEDAEGTIKVLKEGSEIRFKITSSNPMAWYNHCYNGIQYNDPGSYDEYGMDDCGGGSVWYVDYETGALDGAFPMFLLGNADGSVNYTAGAMFEGLLGKKTGEGEYTYYPQNGVFTYTFMPKEYDPEYDLRTSHTGYYELCTAITVNDAQIAEIAETGAVTFYEGTEAVNTAIYPGLAEALGIEGVASDVSDDYADEEEIGFSIDGAIGNSSDKFFFGEPFINAEGPVVVTGDEGLNGFGVSTLIPMGDQYIEGAYIEPDNADGGNTYTINEPGLYYIWATVGDESWDEAMEVLSVPAAYTYSKVIVNGERVEFEAYNINDNNYFKLRDIAKVLSGTDKQFDVAWNGDTSSIDLISGEAYTVVGGELVAGDGIPKRAISGTSDIAKDGEYVTLKAYMINNNNYFKLRDLGEAFDFDVSWDGENNCIIIDTSKGYTAD